MHPLDGSGLRLSLVPREFYEQVELFLTVGGELATPGVPCALFLVAVDSRLVDPVLLAVDRIPSDGRWVRTDRIPPGLEGHSFTFQALRSSATSRTFSNRETAVIVDRPGG